jgi:hypothetical protein
MGEFALRSLFNPENAPKNKKSMAHELAHYYFGTLLRSEGILGPVIAEGFAEYLSLELTRSLEGDNICRSLVRDKIKELTYLHDYQPISLVKKESDYGNREYYLYYYAPILFMAIQKEIGDPAMQEWLKAMVNSKAEVTDYQFLVTTLAAAAKDERLVETVKSKYFTSPDALKNALDEIGVN